MSHGSSAKKKVDMPGDACDAAGVNLKDLPGEDEDTKPKVPWIKTTKADSIFGAVILANAAWMGIDLELGTDGHNWGFWAVETVFLIIFGIELVLRVAAEHPRYWRFCDAWGIFDSLVTGMGMIDAWVLTLVFGTDTENNLGSLTVLRMFRLVRLVRLIRVLRMFKELVVLVQTIASSIVAVAWSSLLLGMIVYAGSVLTMMLIGVPYRDSDEDVAQFFGSLGSAVFSHFCVVTLEGWPDVAMAAIKHNKLWGVYFVVIIILTNFALLNLMVGVIVERIMHNSQEQENELASFIAESEQFRITMQAFFQSADMDHSGSMSKPELREFLKDPDLKAVMDSFGINLNIPSDVLYRIIDCDNDSDTTFDEFFEAVLRMSGSKSNLHSVFVQSDICRVQREMMSRFDDLEAALALGSAGQASAATPQNKSSFNVSARTSDGSGGPRGGVVQNGVSELLARMDRFSELQESMLAEVTALSEYAKIARPPGGANFDGVAEAAPLLVHRAGLELQDCCVQSLFSERRTPIGAAARRSRSAQPSRSDSSNVPGQSHPLRGR